MCTGVAKKFLGKGVVGVYGDMTNSRKERGAGMCHSLVTAQGGDMWLQQQLVPLLVTRQELCARGDCHTQLRDPALAELRMPGSSLKGR